MQSDHKPVFSVFEVPIKLIKQEIKKKLKNEILEELYTQRQDNLPKVKISSTEFEFNHVCYNTLQEQTLAIQNIGKSIIIFNISVDKSLDWLKFSQLKGSIISGESLEITLKVLFNKAEDEKSNYFTANARLKIVNGIEENLIMHVDFVG